MRSTLYTILLLLFTTHIRAQEKQPWDAFQEEVKKQSDVFVSEAAFAKAQTYFLNKVWDSTLVYTHRQLERSKEKSTIADFCHFFRGKSFLEKGLFKEARAEYLKIQSGFPFAHRAQYNLGFIAIELNEINTALQLYKYLESQPTDALLWVNRTDLIENIALCYLLLKDNKNAEIYFNKNITFKEQERDTLGLIALYGNVANFYYNQYQDAIAIPYFEKAYNLSKHTKDFQSKKTATRNMAVVEENRNNLKQSLVYYKEFQALNDSINEQSTIYEVAQIEKKFEVSQKQQEVDLLRAENEVKAAQRNGLMLSAGILLALLSTVFYFYKEKSKSNKVISAQKENLDALNATKDKLFSIVSHDLRSSVNALKKSNTTLVNTLASKNLEKLDEQLNTNSSIVNGAYNLLDNLLNWAMLQTKQSFFLIEEQRLFFIVEQVAFNYKGIMHDKNISFQNNIKKNAKIYADQESLKIILRNFLDNAIKFTTEGDSIHLYGQDKNESFYDLVIEDSGIGMKEDTRVELQKETPLLAKKENENIIGTGLGLQLCKSMIKKNKGSFLIESTLGKGTKMIVSLPKIPLNG